MVSIGEQALSNDFDPVVKNRLLDVLADKSIFAPDAPVSQYVTERVEAICGDEYPAPRVIVCDDEEPNAISLPGHIIVNTGLLDFCEASEELDAVLAHEQTHLNEEHYERKATGLLGCLGEARSNEVTADVKGMALMDRREINPRGMISVFEKLHKHLEQREQKASVQHGSAEDRAINIDESFRMYDARSLVYGPLTPLPEIPRDPEREVLSDPEAATDDPLLRQALMARQFRTFKGDAEELQAVVARQQRLLEESGGITVTDDAEYLARVIAVQHNPKLTKKLLGKRASPDTILQFLAATEHPQIEALCGPYSKKQIEQVTKRLFKKVMQSDSAVPAITSMLHEVAAKTGSYDFVSPGLDEYAFSIKSIKEVDRLAAITAPTDLPIKTSNLEGMFYSRYLTRVSHARLEHFRKLQEGSDTVRVLEYLTRRYVDPATTTAGSDLNGKYRLFEALGWEAAIIEEAPNKKDDALEGGKFHKGEIYEFAVNLDIKNNISRLVAQVEQADLDDETKRRIGLFLLDVHLIDEQYQDGVERLRLLPLYLLTGNKGNTRRLLEDSLLGISTVITATVARRKRGADPDALDEVFDVVRDGSAASIAVRAMARKLRESGWTMRAADEDTQYRVTNDIWTEKVRSSASNASLSDEYMTLLQDYMAKNRLARDHSLLAALEQLNADQDPSVLLDLMKTQGLTRIGGGGAFIDAEKARIAEKYWRAGVAEVLQKSDLMESDESLRLLMALGMIADNVEINLHVPAEALRRLIQLHSFDEGLALVFDEFKQLPAGVKHSAVEELIEKKAKTLEDFEKLDGYMVDYLSSFVDDNQAAIGFGSVIETYVMDAYKQAREHERNVGIKHDTITGLESVRSIEAMLGTAQNDEAIRKYIFERWWLLYRTNAFGRETDLESYFRVEDILVWRYPHKQAQLQYWINELPPAGKYKPAEELLNNLYLSNASARWLAVRKILLGKGGVLDDEEGRQGLVDGLMGSWLAFEEGSDAQRLLQNLLNSFMESTESRNVYKFIGPILQELILRPPKVFADNRVIARQKAEQVIEHLHSSGRLRNPTEADISNVSQKIINLMRGKTDAGETVAVDAADDIEAKLLSLFGPQDLYEFTTMSPTELALMSGKKAGALGIRMLQLAGQYYEIPENEREKFNEVYDSMKGQTRLQAYRVLKREAEHSEAVAELLDDIVSIDERLGGGSLVTVYSVTLRDGSEEVVSIRNPNAEYQVLQLATVIQKTLDTALTRDPENKDLLLAQSLIRDAVTWIRDELNDTEFTAKDTVFRAENDTRIGNGFQRGRSKYDLYIPQARPTDSAWVRREKKVRGVNLNNLTIIDDGPTDLSAQTISRGDYKDAISVITRSFFHQLGEGQYAHSDIHMGNFRITEDNAAVAVFDRYNLIPITDELRSTVHEITRSIAGGNLRGAIAAIVQHAQSDGNAEAVVDQVMAAMPGGQSSVADMVQTLIELKKAGVELPIHLSLLLRNIFSLSQVSQKAGFGNLVEAFLHTAGEEEMARALTRIMG